MGLLDVGGDRADARRPSCLLHDLAHLLPPLSLTMRFGDFGAAQQAVYSLHHCSLKPCATRGLLRFRVRAARNAG
jgi:hypothetical protein